MTSSLELPLQARQRTPSRRTTNLVLLGLAVILLVTWLGWFLNTPPALSTTDRQVAGASVAGTPVYVGMYTPPSGFDRSIRVTGVKVDARASAEVDITPLLCRGGAVGVTTMPGQFCSELINPQGEDFDASDSLVLEVAATDAAQVEIDRIRVGFHQGLRAATSPAGIAGATLTFGGPAD